MFDDTAPYSIPAGATPMCGQREPTAAAPVNVAVATQSDHVLVECPRCEDLESGVATGFVSVEAAATGSVVNTAALGSSWTPTYMVMGVPKRTPLTHNQRYLVSCECTNGASLSSGFTSNTVLVDLTAPQCDFLVQSPHTNPAQSLGMSWSCRDGERYGRSSARLTMFFF